MSDTCKGEEKAARRKRELHEKYFCAEDHVSDHLVLQYVALIVIAKVDIGDGNNRRYGKQHIGWLSGVTSDLVYRYSITLRYRRADLPG